MSDFIKKERAMDCVYEAAKTSEMKDSAISDLLYRIRVKIAQEPTTNILLGQALRALATTESTIPCDSCKIEYCSYDYCPSQDCWYNYLKLKEKEYKERDDKMDKQKELITTIENCRKTIEEATKTLQGAISDICDLLKPRVLALEEVLEWKDSIWAEEKNGALYPALIKRIFADRKVMELYDYSHNYGPTSCEFDDYNKLERFWTAKPTPLQQEITKWDE